MSRDGARQPWPARLALALYPTAWRDRYGDEVLALMAQAGGGTRAAASLAWHAVPAWICPPRHLYADPPARMRASLGAVLLAWSVLAALSLAFAQLTQLQGAVPRGLIHVALANGRVLYVSTVSYPEIVTRSYLVFDAALGLSALAVGIGGLPLWLVMLRRARREYRQRDLARLLLPVIVPACYLAAVVIVVTLLHHRDGVGESWFLIFVLTGLAAAVIAALGPARALRSMKPRGPAVRFASGAALVGVAGIVVAALASSTAAIALYLSARALVTPGYVFRISEAQAVARWLQTDLQYRSTAMLITYLALVAIAGAVAAVSASRAARAALGGPARPPRR